MTQSATIIQQKSSQDTREKIRKGRWPTPSSHPWRAKIQLAELASPQLTETRDMERFPGSSPSYMGIV